MRLLLVLGLVAAALAASGRTRSKWDSEERTHIREHEYRASREYRYEYNGQIATGFPQASEQHASTRIQALLSVYVKDQNNAVFQIRNVRIGQLNEELPEPREVQPFEAYDEIEIQPEHERLLKLPVRVQYEHGLIGDLEFDSDDMAWSKNIKKAILSVMQINLEKNDRTDRDELKKLGHEDQDKTQEFYTVSEKTVEGECESAYTVVKMPRQEQDESSVERLQVSKSINFEKCRRRVDLRYGLRFGSECPSCEKKFSDDEKNTESSTVVAYNVTRRQSGFLIREVDIRSQYVFAPLSQSDNVLTTISVARLVLNTIKEKSQSVPEPKRGDKEEIIYSTEFDEKKERFAMNGDEDFLEYFPYGEQQNKVQLIEKTVAAMLKHMNAKDNSIDAEAPHMMARLVKLLRWTTKEDLQKVVRLYFTESDKLEQDSVEKLQSLLADALAIAGTKNTVETLTQMIQDKKVSVLKGVQVLKTLVNVPMPSEKIVESLLRLCQSSHSERNPALKQSCWLTTGAVMHGLCGSTEEKFAVQQLEKESNKKMCPRQLKEKYVKVLMEQYKKAETRYEKVLALKTLANAGIDMSVFELEKIIRDQSLDKTVRMQAIDALRQLRDQMPRKIQSLLMPILKNKYEHVEVRMNAYYQLIETLPERHILDQVAAQLRFEPSQQLQAFVYSSMLQFANSTNPCQKKMAEDMQASLRMARVSQPRRLLEQSRYQHLPLYSQSALSGASLNWASIFGNNSYLPKEMMASIDTVFAGEWNKYALQFGFYQQNLETVIAKVLEILKGEKLEDIVVRGKRSSGRPQEQLRELFKTLKIRARRGDGQEPHGLLYIRYKDLDYAFVPLDEETLPEIMKGMMRDGQFKLQSLERLLATGFNFDANMAAFFYETQRKIPTSMGLPLVVSGKIPTVASIRGQIKVELQPRNSQKLSGVKVRVAIEPRLAATHVTKMELWNPIANSGIKVLHDLQTVLPIDTTFTVDTETQKGVIVENVFKMPQHKKRIFSAQTRPATFTRVWQQKSRVYTEPKEKTIVSELLPQHQDMDQVYGEKEMGVIVRVTGHWHRHLLQQQPGAPVPILAGHNFVHVEYEPTSETPKEIRTQIIVDGFDELEKMEEVQELNKFYEKKIRFGSDEDLFEVEDIDEFPEDETERRQSYERYSKQLGEKKAFKHNLIAKFETVGGVRREGQLQIESMCDEEIRVCKWTVRCQHTPFSREGRGLWTLKADIQTLYPNVAYSLEELKEQKHREFTLQMKAEWGQEQKSRMAMKVQGEQNAEQKQWMRHVQSHSEDKKQPVEVYEQMLEASQLNQYKLVVDYELTPRAQSAYNTLYETLKRWFGWQAEVSLSKTSDNQITAKLSIDPRYRQLVNITVETPEERLRVQDLQLPIKVSPLNIRREFGRVSSVQSLLKKGISGSRAECVVKSTRVSTFDDVLYKAPISTCYSVLAKDCSDEEPKFVVLMKKMEKNGEEKKLKVISEQNVIEIEQPKNDEPLEISVNGERLQKKQIRQLQEYNIELKQEGELVTIELDDVTIHFDGYSARVQLSPLYLSQQCGVCGHYDGERGDEFRGADNELTDDVQAFHSSFLHKEECEMDSEYQQKRHFRVLDSEEQEEEEREQQSLFDSNEDSQEQEYNSEETSEEQKPRRERKQQKDSSEETSEERETRKPVKKTMVLERGEQICFSKKPLPECPRKSYAVEEKKVDKEVDFACFERSSLKARELLHDVRQGEILRLRDQTTAFQQTITVPTLCFVY